MVEKLVKSQKFWTYNILIISIASIVFLPIVNSIQNDIQEIEVPNSSGDGDIEWTQTWGGNSTSGNGIWIDEDYIYTSGITTMFHQPCIQKWDKQGSLIWNITLKSYNDVYLFGFGMWGDKDFIYSVGFSADYDTILIKCSKEGHILWDRTINKSIYRLHNITYGLCGDDENLYLISEYGNSGLCISAWNKNGNQIWNRTRIVETAIYAYGISCDDNGIYICGSIAVDTGDDYDYNIFLMKYSKSGIFTWINTFQNDGDDEGIKLWVDDERITICGYGDWSSENCDNILVQFDTQGNILWNSSYGGNYDEMTFGIWGNGNNLYSCGIIDVGYSTSLTIAKWTMNGRLVWNETISFSIDTRAYSITGDNNAIYICGESDTLILVKINVSNFIRDFKISLYAVGAGLILPLGTYIIAKYSRKYYKKQKSERIFEEDLSELEILRSQLKSTRDYQSTLLKLEQKIAKWEKNIDPRYYKQWDLLYQECLVNEQFQTKLTEIKNETIQGNQTKAYTELINLLKRTHYPEYDQYIDKALVSDITETLKQVSDNLNSS